VGDEESASRNAFPSEIESYARRTTIFDYLFRGSLVLTGEKASGTVLIDQTKLVANNVKGIIVKGSGHWLMEEAPGQVIPEVVSFISDVPDTASIRRLTPKDINALNEVNLPGFRLSAMHSMYSSAPCSRQTLLALAGQ
jgi:hypothetical protein